MKVSPVLLSLIVYGAGASAFAETPAAVGSAPATAAASSVADDLLALVTPQPPNPKRTYLTLRYDEDWQWLGQPHADHDLFDPIKYIPLSTEKDLTLTVGASIRFRYEDRLNPGFGATSAASPAANDHYFLDRYFIHGDLRYRDLARLFVEGEFAYIDANRRNPPATPFPSNSADLHQAFLDISPVHKDRDGLGLTFRMGRQELLFDKEKLVGTVDWANARRTFDGVSILAQVEDYKMVLFWMRPVVVDPGKFDSSDDDTNFAGLHLTHPLFTKDHNLSAFVYYLNRSRPTTTTLPNTEYNPNLTAGDTDRVTIGGRFWGKFDAFDYDAEGGVQVGQLSGDNILAGYTSLEGGYTCADLPATPRLSLGYDYATGDSAPGDGKAGTFDQLFPSGHLWLGYLDLIGRQNIDAANVTLAIRPTRDLKVWASWHEFFLADSRDALYNAGGQAYRRSITGSAGSYVGNELDVTASYQLGRHTTFLAGYGVFFPGEFIQNTGKADVVQMLFTSVEFRF